mmetsp:Transcript_7461/g.15574  ORF Transcript_7461/g.15574 Transcript_7461/m.15574 type:complete len:937 (-) Transcript_7461:66-2876(-)
MATLLPTLSSDEEDADAPSEEKKEKTANGVHESESDDDDDADDEEAIDQSFEFGGLLGEDGGGFASISAGVGLGGVGSGSDAASNSWSYKSALRLLEQNDSGGSAKPERTSVASIIAAARGNIKRTGKDKDDEASAKDDDRNVDDVDTGGSASASSSSSSNDDDSDNDSGSDSEGDEVDDAHAVVDMEGDVLKERSRLVTRKKSKRQSSSDDTQDETGSENDIDDIDDEEDEADEEAKIEAKRANEYFDTLSPADASSIVSFAQLSLSRPLLRGVASMDFVTPTPIQASVVPVALAGRDVCASAFTGSGKTAAFLLPIMERILQRGGGRAAAAGKKKGRDFSEASASTRALILTPTRELAAQCVSMMAAMSKFTSLRAALVVGGAKNVAAQAAELRTRPDAIVATPGRILDHVTNSPGVDLDDLEFLVLDEADRLLDLGFQDETHEIVKSCPAERQTLLFSATMGTKVDDLVKLSLKRPVRVRISDRKKRGTADEVGIGSADGAVVEVAHRLEQEFVRVRTGNEGVNREGMLLSLLTRTFKSRTIVFFDTKAAAHRLMIICGLCGIKCAELHGNLTQTQRLEALEAFREGNVNVLLATDLAARGLDISGVEAVVNFEMPSRVETYVHRCGRTARAGRGGKSCTLIGEGRRYLMKEVIKDAEQKRQKAESLAQRTGAASSSGIIRSRTIPPAVVAHFVAKITSLEPHIEDVLAAEAVARMDRIAEMEAMRARNIIEHSNEIKSRPQREWFASTKQKQSAREIAAEKQRMIAEKVGTGKHRMTRKKRRAREAKDEALQMQEEMRQEQEEAGTKPGKIVTEQSMKSSARAAKREGARKEKELSAKSLHDEDREREKKQRETRKRRSKKGAFAIDAMGDSSLFDEEKGHYAAKGTNKAQETASSSSSRYQFTEFDPNMKKRKGGKKAHNAFKSKKKFKRR